MNFKRQCAKSWQHVSGESKIAVKGFPEKADFILRLRIHQCAEEWDVGEGT